MRTEFHASESLTRFQAGSPVHRYFFLNGLYCMQLLKHDSRSERNIP